jgi:hypothetical protein
MTTKRVGAGVLFLAGGAIIGGLAGYGIERSSLIFIFSGKPSMMATPGEAYHHYPNPLDGSFPTVLGLVGALGGAVAGKIFEATQKNNDKNPTA